jgi:eukaryotic-like serine/threonine-protein kinase
LSRPPSPTTIDLEVFATSTLHSPALVRGDVLAPGLQVVAHLSRGETCDVYEIADARRRPRTVAKTLRPDRVENEDARRWLRVEARLLADIAHPHVAHAYETLDEPHATVLLDANPGLTLSRALERCRRGLPARRVAVLGAQIGDAIRHLHGRGVLHLGLGPSNIVLAEEGTWLLDLGLARGPGRLGSAEPGLLAPEQAGDVPVGAAADVWGLGALLFEAATGRPPLPESTLSRGAQLDGRAPPVGALRRLPHALAAVIDHCLEPEPASRPQIDEALRALARVA